MTKKRIIYRANRYPSSGRIDFIDTDSLEELVAKLSAWIKLKNRGDIVVTSTEVPAEK